MFRKHSNWASAHKDLGWNIGTVEKASISWKIYVRVVSQCLTHAYKSYGTHATSNSTEMVTCRSGPQCDGLPEIPATYLQDWERLPLENHFKLHQPKYVSLHLFFKLHVSKLRTFSKLNACDNNHLAHICERCISEQMHPPQSHRSSVVLDYWQLHCEQNFGKHSRYLRHRSRSVVTLHFVLLMPEDISCFCRG